RKYNVSRTTIYNVLKERETSVEQLISDRSYSCGDCRYWRQTDHTPLGVGAGICRRFRRHEENALEDEPFIHTEGHMKINFATPKEFGCVLGKTREPKTTDVETQVSVPEQ
ncbi:MAG: hypothetical protein OXG15_02460, partial [Gammaproteobacteria bacterium]|nr:hypothetical protein [Gammaproteobacteria bacterium]